MQYRLKKLVRIMFSNKRCFLLGQSFACHETRDAQTKDDNTKDRHRCRGWNGRASVRCYGAECGHRVVGKANEIGGHPTYKENTWCEFMKLYDITLISWLTTVTVNWSSATAKSKDHSAELS